MHDSLHRLCCGQYSRGHWQPLGTDNFAALIHDPGTQYTASHSSTNGWKSISKLLLTADSTVNGNEFNQLPLDFPLVGAAAAAVTKEGANKK